ncbi:peptidoglycan DD-metalloendopeptidase family protein [soil metagenome]
MSASIKKSWYLLFLLLLPLLIHAQQGKKDLEAKKAKIQKEIEFTNRQLQIVSKNKSATADQLDALRKKISLRQSLIGTINTEISSLGGAIDNTSKEITSLEQQMLKLRSDYAEMIRYAYKNRNVYQRLMFIFAAEDFNQAYRRLKYLQQYGIYRRDQARQIEQTSSTLTGKKQELEAKKSEKTSLRNSEQQQKSTLEKERMQQDQLMKNLTEREKKLRKDLAEKQIAKAKLDKAIENVIRKEIDAAKKKATASGKKNVTNTNVFNLTPESQKLSSNFSGNKGMLPWPVEQGTIISTFGEHPHKELKGIIIKNNGVDIQTSKGSGARALFEGTVSGIINIPGSGKAVIIRHGEYLSVYSNLESASVKTGDKVTTKQRIGTVGESSEGTRGEVHLEIWKNTLKMDPQAWLARR